MTRQPIAQDKRMVLISWIMRRKFRCIVVIIMLGHSSLSVTMRYAHANFESKRAAVAKLEGFGDNLVTVAGKVHQSRAVLSLNRPAS